MKRATEQIAKSRQFDPVLLQHVSPLSWEHINLTGDYTWHANKRVAKGRQTPPKLPDRLRRSLEYINFPFSECPHLEQVAVDLKIRLVFSTPGKPQGRGRVERFFRTLNEMFLCDLDGYTHRSSRKPRLTLGQLEVLFRTFLLEIYHKRASSTGLLAPSERWEHGGFLPRMPESLEQLDLLLMQEVRARKVRRDGIHFQSLRYLSLTLAAYVGEDVTIRFDPRDMGEIRVFHRDRFLCRAISSELAGETIPLRDIIRARNRRRNELRSILHDRQKLVDTLLQLKQGRSRRKSMQLPLSEHGQQPASNGTEATNGGFLRPSSMTDLSSSAMPAGDSDTSASATVLPELEKRFRRFTTAAAK